MKRALAAGADLLRLGQVVLDALARQVRRQALAAAFLGRRRWLPVWHVVEFVFLGKRGCILFGFVEEAALAARLLGRWREALELGQPELILQERDPLLQFGDLALVVGRRRSPLLKVADVVAKLGMDGGDEVG